MKEAFERHMATHKRLLEFVCTLKLPHLKVAEGVISELQEADNAFTLEMEALAILWMNRTIAQKNQTTFFKDLLSRVIDKSPKENIQDEIRTLKRFLEEQVVPDKCEAEELSEIKKMIRDKVSSR